MEKDKRLAEIITDIIFHHTSCDYHKDEGFFPARSMRTTVIMLKTTRLSSGVKQTIHARCSMRTCFAGIRI